MGPKSEAEHEAGPARAATTGRWQTCITRTFGQVHSFPHPHPTPNPAGRRQMTTTMRAVLRQMATENNIEPHAKHFLLFPVRRDGEGVARIDPLSHG